MRTVDVKKWPSSAALGRFRGVDAGWGLVEEVVEVAVFGAGDEGG